MPERAPRWLRIAVAALVAVMVGWLLIADSGDDGASDAATTPTSVVTTTDPGPTTGGGADTARPSIAVSGLPASFTEELPSEAVDVLDTIARGGPHPYRQDGATFFNREGLLPPADAGYYREYTVQTPGSDDRGARRLVTGARGEVFYTGDHYASFVEVVDARV